jgi:Lytic transglycolase
MFGTRHPNRPNCAAAILLFLAAFVAAGCGASSPPATVLTERAPAAADPPHDPQVARASSPTAPRNASAAGTSRPVAPRRPKRGRPIPPAHPVPAAFRPAPGALSDAEVRAELAQLDAVQRQEHERALSAAAASLAGLLPWSLEPKSGIQVSVASVFRDYGLGLACGGVLGRDQLGVAHKTAPCGTLITFTYAGRSLTVPVIDRGPYVAGREWDLTGATAAVLGFPGLGQIEWSVAG